MLPLEVEFLIIEQLDDKPSLSSCSCVCRSWLQFSRFCLFSDLTIRLPRKDADRLEAFLRFLTRSSRSTRPLGNYVKRLALRGEDAFLPVSAAYSLGDCTCSSDASTNSDLDHLANPGVTDVDQDDEPVDCFNIPVSSLRALLSLCPNVKILDLERLLLYDEPPSPQFATLVASFCPRPLASLFVVDCSSTTKDLRHFFEIITMFTTIDQLYVDSVEWELPVGSPRYELPPPSPIIRDLTLQALDDPGCSSALYDSLRRSGSLDGPLTTVQFTGFTLEEVLGFFDFLQDAGKNLTELCIDMYFALRSSPGMPEDWRGVTLDSCPKLEKFMVIFEFDKPDEMCWVRVEIIRIALRIYTRLIATRPSLREVAFCIYAGANAPLAFSRSAESRPEVWGALDRALAELPKLGAMKFVLCDVDAGALEKCKTELWAFVEEFLPVTVKRGVVALRSEEEEYPDLD